MTQSQYLSVLFMLGAILGVGIGAVSFIGTMSHTLEDIRSINSEMRDTLNCQTWEDSACEID